MARARPQAGPWGGALFRRVAAEAANGWTPGLTLLHGDDDWHLERAQRSIVEALVPDPSDAFALTAIADGRIDSAELVGRARSAGMFAERRVVLVRDAAVIEGEPEPILRFAEHPPSEGYLVVRARKLDRKRKLHQALASGRTLEFRAAETEAELRELVREATDLAKEKGVVLATRSVALLVEWCSGDLVRVDRELDKLRDWAGTGRREPIPDEVLRELVGGSETMTGWELGDLILARERGAALATARRYANAGEEAIKIVGGLAWRSRVMLQAKAMLASGAREDHVVTATRAWAYRTALLAGLQRYRLDELRAFPARLLAADRALKSRQIGPRAVLESLVDDLTRPSRTPSESSR